jgi:hypothetical protein
MNTSRVAHLRVAPHNIALRSIQDGLFQRAHAEIMKRAMENVTLTLEYRCVGRGRNGSSETVFRGDRAIALPTSAER